MSPPFDREIPWKTECIECFATGEFTEAVRKLLPKP